MRRATLMMPALAILAACGGNTDPTPGGGGGTCHGIAADTGFEATITYAYQVDGIAPNSGFGISANDNGTLQAHLSRMSSGPDTAVWIGGLASGSVASVNQRQLDGTDTSTYYSSGEVITNGSAISAMNLTVDLQHCTYRVEAAASVNAFLTDPHGNETVTDTPVIELQFADTVPADWATAGLNRGDGSLPAHSDAWVGQHTDQDVLVPLGIVGQLFDGSADEASAGQGTGGFQMDPSH